ncbi:MAG: META domain-containing protein [Gemmatimonadota bacterium]|nr:META domain-containing protein [Gemmatimonadota bacterium]
MPSLRIIMPLLRLGLGLASALLVAACTKSTSDAAPQFPSPATPVDTTKITTTADLPAKIDSMSMKPPLLAQHIENRNWSLVSIGASADANGLASSGITLHFDRTKSVASGSGGCNRYSGRYTQHADSLKFGAMTSTKMACADVTSSSLEMIYLSMLPSVIGYRVDRTGLALYGMSGIVARFVSAP